MSFTRIFRTDFDGTLPNLHTVAGRNGVISEPGTGLLNISCGSGVNCYKWDTTNNAPMAYAWGVSQIRRRLMMAQCRVTAYSWSGLTNLAHITIEDPSNKNRWAYGGWYPSNSNFYMQSNNNGTETGNNWGTYTGPSTTPHIWRIIWNPWDNTLEDSELGVVLSGNQYTAQFSPDDGSSWFTATAIHSLSWDLTNVYIGLSFRNWDPYPSVNLDFDWFEIWEQDEHVALLGGGDQEELDSDKGGWEDEFDIKNLQGPDKWQGSGIQEGVGNVLPGRVDQEVRNPYPGGQKPESGWEDGPLDFREAGGPPKWSHPVDLIDEGQVGAGQRLAGAPEHPAAPRYSEAGALEPTAGWEDEDPHFVPMPGPKDWSSQEFHEGVIISSKQPLNPQGGASEGNRRIESGWEDRPVVQVDPPADYMSEYLDGDGKSLLGGFGINFVKMIYPSQAPFGAPTPVNHFTGVAQDGLWYYDGLPTLYGVFCSGGNLNRRAWRFSEDLIQNPGTYYGVPTVVADDHISLSGSVPGGASWKTYTLLNSVFRWALEGDFDIQVDYKNFSKVASGSTHWEGYMSVHSRDGNSSCRVGVVIRTDNVRKWRADTNSWNNEYGTAPVEDTLRLVRTGSNIEFFRSDGVGGWISFGVRSTSGNIETAPVFLQFHSAGYEAANGTLEWANFTINSGTIRYTAGWYGETPGDHRGNTAAMPDRLLMVGTQTSIDLIDPDTRLMWMRFVRGANNVLDQWNANLRVYNASWSSIGLLVVAWGEPNGTDGATLFIDFASDRVSLRRTAGSTITSASYDTNTYVMLGEILYRNNAEDWSGDDDDLGIPSNCVLDVDTYNPDGDNSQPGDRNYYAIATEAGMQVQTFLRWYAAESPRKIASSTETDRMWFCEFDQATGDLYYMDETNLYHVTRAIIDIGINGGFTFTFTADNTKALPGSRQFFYQYTMVRIGTDIYVPADEGVYHISWPSGSWVLLYGRPGSGATHEILPEESNHATEIHYVQDGVNDLLLVGVGREVDGSLIAIRMNDHSVWARSRTLPSGRFVLGVAT